MKKEELKDRMNSAIDANFEALNQFIERSLTIFEIESVKREIVNCLILNLNQASITLTNHLLERGLKLALIHSEVGIVPLPIEEWSTKFPGPNKKYGSLILSTAIKLCAEKSLISDDETRILKDIIREQFRNGFSHADMNQILKNTPMRTYMHGSIVNPNSISRVELPQTEIHVLQPILQEDFAKENALPYFEYVYSLLINIEKRLTEKYNKQCKV